jgi:hypothetical protein
LSVIDHIPNITHDDNNAIASQLCVGKAITRAMMALKLAICRQIAFTPTDMLTDPDRSNVTWLWQA